MNFTHFKHSTTVVVDVDNMVVIINFAFIMPYRECEFVF